MSAGRCSDEGARRWEPPDALRIMGSRSLTGQRGAPAGRPGAPWCWWGASIVWVVDGLVTQLVIALDLDLNVFRLQKPSHGNLPAPTVHTNAGAGKPPGPLGWCRLARMRAPGGAGTGSVTPPRAGRARKRPGRLTGTPRRAHSVSVDAARLTVRGLHAPAHAPPAVGAAPGPAAGPAPPTSGTPRRHQEREQNASAGRGRRGQCRTAMDYRRAR